LPTARRYRSKDNESTELKDLRRKSNKFIVFKPVSLSIEKTALISSKKDLNNMEK
jgi:hypothetical protein